MNSLQNTGKLTGALFLALMLAYSLGAFLLIDPVMNDPDFLARAFADRNRVFLGVILEIINGLAYLGIAVLLYPIIKQLNAGLALGYASLRILEFAMQIISDLSPLLITSLSQEYLSVLNPDQSTFQALGSTLLAQRFWANQMVFLTYGLGTIIFYYSMYRLKLIPRFLSLWGMIGAPLVLIDVVLDIYGMLPGVRFGFIMGLNEIVLGVWLVIKGFNPSHVNSFS